MKNLKNIFQFLSLCIFLSSCNIKLQNDNKPKYSEPKSELELANEICETSGWDKLDISKWNELLLGTQFDEKKRQLSGSAHVFSTIIQDSTIIKKYDGLIQQCINKNIRLEFGCTGKMVRLTENGIELKNSMDQLLVKMEGIQVDYLKFCGSLSLSGTTSLFLVAKEVDFDNASFDLKDESFLSISTNKLVNPSGLLKVDLDPKAIMSVYSVDGIKD
jgi:hypothetical protein